MRDGNGHTFGTVNGGTTPHRNQAITSLGLVDLAGRTHSGFCGIGGGLVKYSHLNARQRIQGFLQNACSFHPLVGDDKRFVDANALALLF